MVMLGRRRVVGVRLLHLDETLNAITRIRVIIYEQPQRYYYCDEALHNNFAQHSYTAKFGPELLKIPPCRDLQPHVRAAARSIPWLVWAQLDQPPSLFLANPNLISPSHHQNAQDWPLRVKLSLTGAFRTYESFLNAVESFASCMIRTWHGRRAHPSNWCCSELSCLLVHRAYTTHGLEKHSGTPALLRSRISFVPADKL